MGSPARRHYRTGRPGCKPMTLAEKTRRALKRLNRAARKEEAR